MSTKQPVLYKTFEISELGDRKLIPQVGVHSSLVVIESILAKAGDVIVFEIDGNAGADAVIRGRVTGAIRQFAVERIGA